MTDNHAAASIAAVEDHRDAIAIEPITRRKLWSVNEARALTNLSRASLYDLINSGKLRSVMIAGRRLIPDSAIDELIESELHRQ